MLSIVPEPQVIISGGVEFSITAKPIGDNSSPLSEKGLRVARIVRSRDARRDLDVS